MTAKRAASTTGWGLFCACSWTWCIGLYLPVILAGRLGWPGVAVFAVPNVLGAAAFGYVLSRAGGAALAARHRAACQWFSIAAVAFNAYFIAFVTNMAAPAGGAPWTGVYAGAAVLAAALVLTVLPWRLWPVAALVVYGVSLATFAGLDPASALGIPAEGTLPPRVLWWIAPVMVVGFLGCPYLDLTFHDALQASPSRHAFGVFGASFAVMLLLTCAYRADIVLAVVPFAHIAAQVTFTIGAHLRELRRSRSRGWAIVPVSLAFVALALALSSPGAAGERNYLRFLALYGLVFPAYLLVFAGRGGVPRSRRTLIAFAAFVAISLPLYELGFIHGSFALLPWPLAALVAWRAWRNFAAPRP